MDKLEDCVQAIDDKHVDDGRDDIRIGGSNQKSPYSATLGGRSAQFDGYKKCKSLITWSYGRSIARPGR
jgi:hypothetical protein